jgi:hypothetical protein
MRLCFEHFKIKGRDVVALGKQIIRLVGELNRNSHLRNILTQESSDGSVCCGQMQILNRQTICNK